MSSGSPSVRTRPRATVTSCVPEASRLARMSSPELNFPVPTKSREENSTPAMTRGFVAHEGAGTAGPAARLQAMRQEFGAGSPRSGRRGGGRRRRPPRRRRRRGGRRGPPGSTPPMTQAGRSPQLGDQAADALQAQHGRQPLLGRGEAQRPHPGIVEAAGRRRPQGAAARSFTVPPRIPPGPGAGAPRASRRSAAPEVDAVGARRDRDLDAVVDDEDRAVPAAGRDRGAAPRPARVDGDASFIRSWIQRAPAAHRRVGLLGVGDARCRPGSGTSAESGSWGSSGMAGALQFGRRVADAG